MSTSRGQWFWGETSTTGLFNFLILLDIKHHSAGRFFVTFLQKRVLMHFYKMRIMNINPDCTEISKWVINHELLFVFTCQYSTKENKKANLIHSTRKEKKCEVLGYILFYQLLTIKTRKWRGILEYLCTTHQISSSNFSGKCFHYRHRNTSY